MTGATPPAFRDQVEAALKGEYRLERELGGGGMSRVFVAEQVGLGRRVVVKVLTPELSAGVSRERFRREVQLAAGLQHPHIVPLIAAGEGAGLLWYVMPYIEGESLRSRLARDRRLAPAEAVRYLRDVADALAYAHAQGIVHRDIKPDNILITAGHAVVTDFGVAKALGAGEATLGDGTVPEPLTTTSLALGTPAYMAPEQAAADPAVDHRADLYSTGCVAYEMLAGRPPFTGMPPAQLLAAHVTTPPEPVQAHVELPNGLAAIVMRLLAKRPTDRPASAQALVAELDRVMTPSGGTVISESVRPRRLQDWLERIGIPVALLTYGLAAPVAAVMLRRAAVVIGLPTWVELGGFGLLLVGAGVLLGAAAGWLPWLTRRGAIVGGIVAFALLGAAAGGHAMLRRAGIGPAGSLVGKGKLAQRDRVIVAAFDNRTTDSLLGQLVTDAFRTDFLQSRAVSVLQDRAVADALVRMQRDPAARLDAALARELAQREGVKAVVEGEVAQAGSQYVLTARLVAAADGEVLAAFRETADGDEVITAVDRLSRQLRERIGESLAQLRGEPGLARVTTTSLPALRKYSEAIRVGEKAMARQDRNALQREVQLLEEAVALDSGFAMAWRRLGVRLGNLGLDPRRAAEALARAFQFRDRLPPRERALAEAMYYDRIKGDEDAVIRSYETALAIDSTDVIALNNLGVKYLERGETERMVALADRWIAIDSMQLSAWNWRAVGLATLGRTAQAAATAEAMERRFGAERPEVALVRTVLLWRDGRWAEIGARLARAVRGAEDDGARAQLLATQAEVALLQGRLAEALRLQRSAQLASPALDEADRRLDLGQLLLVESQAEAFLRRRPARARVLADSAARVMRLDSLVPERRPLLALAGAYAVAGEGARAQELLDERDRIAATLPGPARRAYGDSTAPMVLLARGWRWFGAGRAAEAVPLFRGAATRRKGGLEAKAALGFALAAAGEADSAIAELEGFLASPDADARVGVDPTFRAPVLEALGALYERRGDRAKALDRYQQFVDLWRGADPDLQPRVQAARGALARLVAEPRARG
ncbi:MAG: serine/threonine-protein kinase [Gemmatimonadales bacterium]|nr:serine/threonine-protein kinase [Gemmatimonadales bacterium]